MQQIGRILVCAFALVLTGCSAGVDSNEPAPTLPQAAENYLATVCPVNAKWDDVDLAVDALEIERDKGKTGDLAAVTDALDVLSQTAAQAAGNLEAQQWPESADEAVLAVAEALQEDAETAQKVQGFSADKVMSYQWPHAAETKKLVDHARQQLQATESCTEFDASEESEHSQ